MYSLNPRRLYKIWLSKDPAIFMPEINQERMIELRENNPHAVIALVYDSRLLNEASKKLMQSFCFTHKIQLKDAAKLIELCQDDKELALVGKYEDEVLHINELGNLGAASDFLRMLTPMLQLGIYTDLDVLVAFRDFHRALDIKSPFIFNLEGTPVDLARMRHEVNNDVLAVADLDAAKDVLDKIREAMLTACNGYAISQYFKMMYPETPTKAQVRQLMKEDENLECIVLLSAVLQGDSLRQWRSDIIQLFDDTEIFCKIWIACYGEIVTKEPIKQFITLARAINLDRLTRNPDREAYQELARMDDVEFLNTLLDELKFGMLTQSVTISSGPGSIHAALLDSQIGYRDYCERIKPYSFQSYSMLKIAIIPPEEGDLSWLDDADELKPIDNRSTFNHS